MAVKRITESLSVSPQISKDEVASIAQMGFKSFICSRPDNEGEDQTNFAEIEAVALQHGIRCHYLPVVSGQVSDADAKSMSKLVATLEQPVLAYCRTGTRCIMLWALDQAITESTPLGTLKQKAREAGYNLDAFLYRFNAPKDLSSSERFDIVIIGGGTSGITTAASIFKSNKNVKLAIVEPSDVHHYQPAWTLVGGGCYDISKSQRNTHDLIPKPATWVRERIE